MSGFTNKTKKRAKPGPRPNYAVLEEVPFTTPQMNAVDAEAGRLPDLLVEQLSARVPEDTMDVLRPHLETITEIFVTSLGKCFDDSNATRRFPDNLTELRTRFKNEEEKLIYELDTQITPCNESEHEIFRETFRQLSQHLEVVMISGIGTQPEGQFRVH